MFKDCGICGKDHKTFAVTVDGATHVYSSKAEQARRNAATVAFKVRYNAEHAKA